MGDWEPKSGRTLKRRRSSGGSTKEVAPKPIKAPAFRALVVDNGAYTIKVGFTTEEEPQVVPNCIMKAKSEKKRLFVGKQIEECRDCSGLYFLLPCEKGYITRWEVQKPVWDHVFSRSVCTIDENPVVITQPLFNFKSIQDCMDEVFFEEYEVSSLFRCTPTDLAYLNYAKHNKLTKSDACLVMDSGFSFTHIVPYVRGSKFLRGVRRVNVGGKLLTNHLKDIISYRQYNVMEETYVINQVKEDTGYVCADVKKELAEASKPFGSNSIVKNYVLPDFNVIRRGYIQETKPENPSEVEESYQVLRLNNERFVVPEILFHPSDIGMKSMGIAEAVVKSIMSSPKEHRQSLAKNIIMVGGNCKFPGFKERMYAELRSLLPDAWQLGLFQHADPITYPWKGGSALLRTHDFRNNLVSKQDYEELGSTLIQERFNNFMLDSRQLDQEDETGKHSTEFQYLSKLKSASIFGKQEVSAADSDIQIDSKAVETAALDKEDVGAEEAGQDAEGNKRGKSRNKALEETEVAADVEAESSEEDLTESPSLFPLGCASYL
ncbi:actin-related protein 6 [Dendroctonus ponderosae]|uniref:actin-related protein 6 n=1 Tax=Dendroctonus ponderosae TaxID=77166 RepID=UPI002034DAF7|nr:actin-related protein 6 [Dendroctonus ponderosae]KAH1008210.1 hypothetical protein HUJ05_008786 [Dendroctonus ponderosae]